MNRRRMWSIGKAGVFAIAGVLLQTLALQGQQSISIAGMTNLQPIAYDPSPGQGVFYLASEIRLNRLGPSYPFNPLAALGLDGPFQCYSLPGGSGVLFDDLSVDYVSLTQQRQLSAALSNLGGGQATGLSAQDDGGGASPLVAYSYASGSFWLEILNPANSIANSGLATIIMHGTEAGQVYELMSKLNLTNESWTVEQAVHGATGQDSTTTTVTIADRTNALYFWARNWTGIDENSNGMPDWWEWENFGNFNQPADGDYDGDGVLNYNEYAGGTDPNKIAFIPELNNDHVNTTSASGTFTILRGVPFQVAVLVDNTNFTSAGWSPCYGSFSASLPSTDGPHQVWVGLKGLASDSQQTWELAAVTLDRVAPLIIITNPAGATTSQPWIQLKGYSPEPLSNLSYDVNNAAGLATNLQGFVLDQFYDTNLHCFTANTFQCFDVDLTNGANTITLRATDLAGNTSTNVYTYALDYSGDTTAPSLTLYWPQNATQIASNSFTLRGLLDDPTASVTAQITDSTGTNTFSTVGLVEREGLLWVEDLPLSNGVNTLILTATDAAGNSNTTTITVNQNSVAITMNEVTDDQLWQLTAAVNGTVSPASGYTVWVNGVQAILNGDGNWSAANVPVTPGGTAVFQARAIPDTESAVPGSGPATYQNLQNPSSANARDAEQQKSKGSQIYVQNYQEQWQDHVACCGLYGRDECKDFTYCKFLVDGAPGTRDTTCDLEPWQSFPSAQPAPNHMEYHTTWPADGYPPSLYGSQYCVDDYYGVHQPTAVGPPSLPWEHCSAPPDVSIAGCITNTWTRKAQTTLRLRTGGKAGAHRQNLFSFYCTADEILTPRWWSEIGGPPSPTQAIPPNQITVGDVGQVGNDNCLYKVLPDGQDLDVTPSTPRQFYGFNIGRTKHTLWITANGIPLADERVVPSAKFCVGQKVDLASYMTPPIDDRVSRLDSEWLMDLKFVNWINNGFAGCKYYVLDHSLLLNHETSAWWVLGGTKKTFCKWDIVFSNGQKVSLHGKGQLDMHRPTVVNFLNYPPSFTTITTNLAWLGRPFIMLGMEPPFTNGLINFQMSVQSHFSGQFEYTQVMNLHRYRDEISPAGTWTWDSGSDYWLDTSEAYAGLLWTVSSQFVSGPFPFLDGPGNPVGLSVVEAGDRYRVYARFKPDGEDSIWTTLERVDWSWNAAAINPLGWPYNNIPGSWSILDSSVPAPIEVDDSDFPLWKDIGASTIGQ